MYLLLKFQYLFEKNIWLIKTGGLLLFLKIRIFRFLNETNSLRVITPGKIYKTFAQYHALGIVIKR